MEKPRKLICGTCNGTKRHKDVFGDVIACPHCYLVHQRNETIDAMSTWLEGEVPTVEEIKKVIINECCDAIANDGVDSIVRSGELAQAIHALLLRKLTGKV